MALRLVISFCTLHRHVTTVVIRVLRKQLIDCMTIGKHGRMRGAACAGRSPEQKSMSEVVTINSVNTLLFCMLAATWSISLVHDYDAMSETVKSGKCKPAIDSDTCFISQFRIEMQGPGLWVWGHRH